jgi:hypothetical protein
MGPWQRIKAFFVGRIATFDMSDPFGLRVYGQTLLTPRVKADLFGFTAVMALQWIVDFASWSIAATLVAPEVSWLIRSAVGFVYATFILLVDKFLITMDVSRTRSIVAAVLARAVILLGLAYVTAIPLEMFVFSSEIENRIASVEKAKVDEIRERGKEIERKKNDVLVASADRSHTGESDAVVARRNGDELKAFKEAQDEARKEIKARLSKTSSAYATEQRKSPKTRSETRLAELKADKEAIAAELAAYNAQALKDLEARSATTEQQRADALKRAADERAGLATSLDAKYAEIDAMTSEEVATAYGGEWKQSRGFMDQFRVLNALIEEDPVNKLIAWICRGFMLAFGLGIIALKIASSEELKAYLSLRSQAAAGNPLAIEILRRKGHVLRDGDQAIGYSEEIREKLGELRENRLKLRTAFRAYEASVADHCIQQMADSGERSRAAFNRYTRQLWDSQLGELLDEHARHLGWLQDNAGPLPAWPTEWDMPDPTTATDLANRESDPRPWMVSNDTLALRYNWRPTRA